MKFWKLISAVMAQSLIEKLVFDECNIKEALAAEPETEADYTIKFFIEKTFGGDFEKAVSYLVAKDEPSPHVLLLLSRISAKARIEEDDLEGDSIRLMDDTLVEYMKRICGEISEQYIANRYRFFEIPSLSTSESDEKSDILTNVWTQDPAIVDKFFMLIGQNKLNPGDVLEELEFLASKENPRAFGLIGDVYFYGLGVPADIERAVEYYMAGRRFSDARSYLGLGRVLMHPSYNDLKGAMDALNAIKGGVTDAEASYYKYQLIMSERSTAKALPFLHQQAWQILKTSALGGYLPAVYEYGINDAVHGTLDTALHALLSVSKFSPIILDAAKAACTAYRRGEHMKAVMYSLYLAEFKIDTAMQNAITIMRRHRLLENQDAIMFRLLNEVAKTIPRYHKHIGDCFYYGVGTEQSYEEALACYIYSMDFASESAYNVAYMFEHGLGVPRSLNLAWRYLNSRIMESNKLYLVVFYARLRLAAKMGVGMVLRAYIIVLVAMLGLLYVLFFHRLK